MSDSSTVVQAHDVRAPSGASAPTAAQRIAGTGASASANTTALTVGEWATLLVAGNAVRIGFGSTESAAISAATATAPYLPSGARHAWLVSDRDRHIALRAADGITPYEGHVWTSSGPRAT